VFYLYSPEAMTCLALPTPYRLEIADFPHFLSFGAFIRGDSLRIYGKALRFLKLESSRWPTVKARKGKGVNLYSASRVHASNALFVTN